MHASLVVLLMILMDWIGTIGLVIGWEGLIVYLLFEWNHLCIKDTLATCYVHVHVHSIGIIVHVARCAVRMCTIMIIVMKL